MTALPELLIVGGGPAGVSAALWARALDLTVTLLEGAPTPGGQLHVVHFQPADLPGIEAGSGPEIAATYARQLARAGVPVQTDVVATALEPGGPGRDPAVRLSTGERIAALSILIATGVRRRHLDVPGERDFEGRGVSYSATRDRAELAGKHVAIAGGGDAAYENALLLAQAGCTVSLLVRGAPRARPEFRARIEAEPRITLQAHTRVTAVLGDARLRALRVQTPEGERELACEALVVKVGVLPNTEWCRGVLAHDADGYLRVDDRHATSAFGVFAAGDCTRPSLPSIPVAMAQGAQAAAVIRAALHGR